MGIDRKHKLDVTSRLDSNQARKWLAEVLREGNFNNVALSKHCLDEMQNDSLIPNDVYNALMGGFIYDYPELKNGTYRYRIETQKIVVIIAFQEPDLVRCVTAWRKL